MRRMYKKKKKKSKGAPCSSPLQEKYDLMKQLIELGSVYQHVIKALLDSSLSAVCEHVEDVFIKRLGQPTPSHMEDLKAMGAFDPQANVNYLGVNVWIRTTVFSPFFILNKLEALSEEEIAQFPPDIKAKHDEFLSANSHREKKLAFDATYTEFLAAHGNCAGLPRSVCEKELPALMGEPNKPGQTYHRLNDLIREVLVLAQTFDKRYFFMLSKVPLLPSHPYGPQYRALPSCAPCVNTSRTYKPV